MTYFTSELSRPLLASRLGALLAAARQAARRWAERRAVLEELHRLDARTLADLRIYPADFAAIADGTYARHGSADETVREAPAPRLPTWPYF